MKKTIITALLALVAMAATAAVLASLQWQATIGRAPDSQKKDLEDYDYLVSFVEKNYAPFDAIMQKGYKREYKALKKQIREQLSKGNSSFGEATSDYVMWYYRQFDRHLELETREFQMAEGYMMSEAIIKLDNTWLIRVPSCSTDYHEWTIKALQQFERS